MTFPEQLLDERTIAPGVLTAAQVLAEFPVAPVVSVPPMRTMGFRAALSIWEVLATDDVFSDFAGRTATGRPQLSQPY